MLHNILNLRWFTWTSLTSLLTPNYPSTPGHQVASTSFGHHRTFPTAGENDPHRLISPNQTLEQQVLDPTDPELQLYCTDKVWFDLDLKDLALHFLTPSPRSPVPRAL